MKGARKNERKGHIAPQLIKSRTYQYRGSTKGRTKQKRGHICPHELNWKICTPSAKSRQQCEDYSLFVFGKKASFDITMISYHPFLFVFVAWNIF